MRREINKIENLLEDKHLFEYIGRHLTPYFL